jgi:hypothetical protein
MRSDERDVETLSSAARSLGEVTRHPQGQRVTYVTPRVLALGDLRSVTLGPSPGINESGNPAVLRA